MITLLRNSSITSLLIGLSILSLLLLLFNGWHLSLSASNLWIQTPWWQSFVLKYQLTQGLWPRVTVGLLILMQALAVGLLMERHQVLYENTYMPVFFYGLFMMVEPAQLLPNPVLIANCFLIPMTGFVFASSQGQSLHPINMGLALGGAILFLPQASLLWLLAMLALFIYLNFASRGIVQAIYGTITPIAAAILWWMHQENLTQRFNEIIQIDWFYLNPIKWRFQVEQILFALPLLFWLIVILLRIQQNFFRNTVRTRKNQQYMLGLLIISVILFLTASTHASLRSGYLALPLSVYLSYYFLQRKKPWLKNALFTLLILIILANQLGLISLIKEQLVVQ